MTAVVVANRRIGAALIGGVARKAFGALLAAVETALAVRYHAVIIARAVISERAVVADAVDTERHRGWVAICRRRTAIAFVSVLAGAVVANRRGSPAFSDVAANKALVPSLTAAWAALASRNRAFQVVSAWIVERTVVASTIWTAVERVRTVPHRLTGIEFGPILAHFVRTAEDRLFFIAMRVRCAWIAFVAALTADMPRTTSVIRV